MVVHADDMVFRTGNRILVWTQLAQWMPNSCSAKHGVIGYLDVFQTKQPLLGPKWASKQSATQLRAATLPTGRHRFVRQHYPVPGGRKACAVCARRGFGGVVAAGEHLAGWSPSVHVSCRGRGA